MHVTAPKRGVLIAAAIALAGMTLAMPAAAQGSAGPLYGTTIDRISSISSVVDAARGLPERPTTRVYFSVSEPATYYRAAVAQLDSVSGVMGELLDSSEATHVTTSSFQARVKSYLSTLRTSVGIWEIGNEVNGNWTGAYPTGAARITEAYHDVAAVGAKTALTLYANEYGANHCGDGVTEPTPVQYSQSYVPASVRDGLTYVFESYYPTQCADTFPTSVQVAGEMRQLHTLYPNALLGFGEIGLPHPATRKTLATAERVMSWAYHLNPGLSYYVGGYFWWYAWQDAFTGKRLLSGALSGAFRAESAALAGAP